MITNFIIYGFLSKLQDYLQSEISVPLLLQSYNFNGTEIQKCYFFSPSLDPDPDLFKRLGFSSQEEFFAILYNRRTFEVDNYRTLDIRAFDKETVQALVEAGALPEDYPGKVRFAKVTLQLKFYTNNLAYQYEVEELMFIDWVGASEVEVSVPLNSEITFTTIVGVDVTPYEEIDKDNPTRRLYSGVFEATLSFPLVKLDAKAPLIQDVNYQISTLLYS